MDFKKSVAFVSLLIVIVVFVVGLGIVNKQYPQHMLKLNFLKSENCGDGQLNSDELALYRNGYKQLKNKQFLEYIRKHIIVNPSKQGINLKHPERKDFSQLNQSRLVRKQR